jgi:Fe-S-cluster-containing dehydrogenase component
MDRIDQGLEPACVSVCPTDALSFGRPEELSDKTRETYAHGLLERNLSATSVR